MYVIYITDRERDRERTSEIARERERYMKTLLRSQVSVHKARLRFRPDIKPIPGAPPYPEFKQLFALPSFTAANAIS